MILQEKQKSVVTAILPMFRRIEHDVGKFGLMSMLNASKLLNVKEAAAVVNMIERR